MVQLAEGGVQRASVELRIDTNIIFKNIIGASLSHSRLLRHVWNLLLLLHPQFSHIERGAGDNGPPGSQTKKGRKKKQKLKPPLFISKLTSQNYKSTVLQLQQE